MLLALAMCYTTQGKLNEALKLCQEIMEVQQETYGTQHKIYLITKSILACCYEKQGKLN